MSTKEKLIERLKSKPKDFTWDELISLLSKLGFEIISQGKTGGSRRKFFHRDKNLTISLHKPHPSLVIKKYMIDQIVTKLREEKLI